VTIKLLPGNGAVSLLCIYATLFVWIAFIARISERCFWRKLVLDISFPAVHLQSSKEGKSSQLAGQIAAGCYKKDILKDADLA